MLFLYRRTATGLFYRTLEASMRIAGICLLVLCAAETVSAIYTSAKLPAATLLIPISLALIIFSGFSNTPDLFIDDAGLSIRVFWHWHTLDWNSISTRRYIGNTILVASNELPLIYFWMGFGVWPGKRCFLINAGIESFQTIPFHLQHHGIAHQ